MKVSPAYNQSKSWLRPLYKSEDFDFSAGLVRQTFFLSRRTYTRILHAKQQNQNQSNEILFIFPRKSSALQNSQITVYFFAVGNLLRNKTKGGKMSSREKSSEVDLTNQLPPRHQALNDIVCCFCSLFSSLFNSKLFRMNSKLNKKTSRKLFYTRQGFISFYSGICEGVVRSSRKHHF